ncbi:hypothetical protein RFF05_07490 [Bengtsoniella intestinalis]|uniref:hypothetical protein n=1 Tax=Bengtsoniella intestinalis TaxID=3073143 RepID=UPI00391F2978
MSQTPMLQVTQAEEANVAKKAQAVAQSKAVVAQAQQDGAARLQALEAQCLTQRKEALADAKVQAEQKAAALAKDTQGQVDALVSQAQGQMGQAVDFVVKKVVNP